MPYKDIKLTLLGGRKCLLNPGSILDMISFSNKTIITLQKGMEFYPGKIEVEETFFDIKKMIEPINEAEYWASRHKTNGILVSGVIFDELEKGLAK